jgi:Protein of unknwon function (DUF3310)
MEAKEILRARLEHERVCTVGPKRETVDHPTHYTDSPAYCLQCKRPIECVDVAEHWGFNLGNALKYLWRAGKKGPPVEDLRKAIWYIQRQIDRLLESRVTGATPTEGWKNPLDSPLHVSLPTSKPLSDP